jgi:hypothetical protein
MNKRLLAYISPLDHSKPFALPHSEGTGGWLHWQSEQESAKNHIFEGAIIDCPFGKWPYGNEWTLRFDQLLAIRKHYELQGSEWVRTIDFRDDILTDALLSLKNRYKDLIAYLGCLTGPQQFPSWDAQILPLPEVNDVAWRLRCVRPLIDGGVKTILLDAMGPMPINAPEKSLLSVPDVVVGVEHMPGREQGFMSHVPSLTIIGFQTE